jgi:dTDP-4-amino-4,6-dideoxygalactose transaminase
VEDCAQSHGACYEGRMTGSWGDIGCFSYYPTKNIGAFGDAGSIVTDNKELCEKVRMLRNYGSKIKYQNEILGVNSRLDEIQAALLLVKLSHYQELREERERIARMYLAAITNPLISLPTIRENADHVWHLFVVRTPDRDRFQSFLQANGIGTQVHYPIPPHLSEAYGYLGYKPGDFPITEHFADTVISLPLYEGMTDEEIDYVVEVINRYE